MLSVSGGTMTISAAKLVVLLKVDYSVETPRNLQHNKHRNLKSGQVIIIVLLVPTYMSNLKIIIIYKI